MLGAFRLGSRARRAPSGFGLDIGSTAVKVVELRHRDSSPVVARCARTPIAAGVVAEGAIRDAAAAAAAIREAVAAAGITGRDAIVGLCGRELMVKKLQIPAVPVRELKDAIRIEAEREIPFAIDEVFLDYQITAEGDRLIELTLVAAKRSKVLEYCAAVGAAGLTPVVVDIDGFALGNQHALGAAAAAERAVLVDLGATMTKVAVVGEGLTHLVRDVPFAGHRYTQVIAARLGVPAETAETIKIGARPSPDVPAVAQACDGVSRDLAREIQRALDYCAESDPAAPPVARVALAGGGARLPGLAESLASILGLPVVLAPPVGGLTVEPACEEIVARAGPSLTLALGLSLRHRGDTPGP